MKIYTLLLSLVLTKLQGGSIAVKNAPVFEDWVATFGADKIILGADCTHEKIAVSGWQEESNLNVIPFIQDYQSKGIHYVICTDISKDGMLQGPSFNLYERILKQASDIKLIASGGIFNF